MSFDIAKCEFTNFFLLFKIVLLFKAPLIPYDLRIYFPISAGKVVGILIGVLLNLQITLGCTDIS